MISAAAWVDLKRQIEYHLKQDSNITDIHINYQVKKKKGIKNYLKLNVKIQ